MNEQIRFQDSKSLVFKVGHEEYGVHINQVVSIERMQNITPYPNRPAHVLGVTTIRGEVTPIVDVRSALSGVTLDTSEATRIILVKAADKAIGLVVDAATDVLEITTDSIQQANLMESKDVSYLKGIAKIDDRLIILLDIEMLLEDTTNLDELREIIDTF
jgi:purine-binding chemotaxis protein CheW